MGVVRVATTQLRGETYDNLNEFASYINQLLKQDSKIDILVLPEYSLLPLLKDVRGTTRAEVRKLYDDIFFDMEKDMVDSFKKLATENKTNILVGSHWTQIEGEPYNASYFFTDDGNVHINPKNHGTPPEEAMGMKEGDQPALIELSSGVKVGVLICFDIEFPELSRQLALEGADIILVPSLTLNERGAQRVEISARARAIENQVYVVLSTNHSKLQIPVEKPIQSIGRAGIFGPIDNKTRLVDGIVTMSDKDGENVIVADLDLEILEESRYSSEAPLRKHIKEVKV